MTEDRAIAWAWLPIAHELEAAVTADTFTERTWTGLVDRSEWKPGPWDGEPDAQIWLAHGHRCQIIRSPHFGHLAGYILLPPGHPAHGLSCEALRELDVYGGITLAGTASAGYWCIGFHCANACDVLPYFEAVYERMEDRAVRAMRAVFDAMRPRYRPFSFVREEVERLAQQLARIEQGARS